MLFFNSFFTIPVKIENARLKLALTIANGAPITVVNDAIEMLPYVTDKTINHLSKWSKEAMYLVSPLLINSLNCCWSFKFGYILCVT